MNLKNRRGYAVWVLALLLTLGCHAAQADVQCDNQPIVDLAGMGIHGTATLCANPTGLKAQMRAKGLMPGHDSC